MNKVMLLWAHCPIEAAAYSVIAALCGMILSGLVILLAWSGSNEIDEVTEE